MDFIHGLILITVVHALAAATPGPDFLLVSQQTLTRGRKAGFFCSVGVALGLSVHIIYSSFGLATLIASSSEVFYTIKVLGGAYLIYIGIKGLRSGRRIESSSPLSATAPTSAFNGVRAGFFCNVLNPKAPIYFVSLFTVVLPASIPLHQLIAYGVWMMVVQFAWSSLLVIMLSYPAINQMFKRAGHWLDRVFGGIMIALGLKLIAARSS